MVFAQRSSAQVVYHSMERIKIVVLRFQEEPSCSRTMAAAWLSARSGVSARRTPHRRARHGSIGLCHRRWRMLTNRRGIRLYRTVVSTERHVVLTPGRRRFSGGYAAQPVPLKANRFLFQLLRRNYMSSGQIAAARPPRTTWSWFHRAPTNCSPTGGLAPIVRNLCCKRFLPQSYGGRYGIIVFSE